MNVLFVLSGASLINQLGLLPSIMQTGTKFGPRMAAVAAGPLQGAAQFLGNPLGRSLVGGTIGAVTNQDGTLAGRVRGGLLGGALSTLPLGLPGTGALQSAGASQLMKLGVNPNIAQNLLQTVVPLGLLGIGANQGTGGLGGSAVRAVTGQGGMPGIPGQMGNNAVGLLGYHSVTGEPLYVAGDDDQCIYPWRGADVKSFLNLKGTREVLKTSWRVPQEVFKVAQRVIRRIPKNNRVQKEWKPREEKGSFTEHDDISQIQNQLKTGKWLVLGRDRWRLNELEELVEVSKAYVRHLGPGLTSIDSHDLKDLLRELKHLLARLPRKSLMGIAGGGNRSEGQVEAPANGPQKTSRNEGATETDPDDDPRYWGADAVNLYTRRGGGHA